ncbi:MAG TPA: MlaD family protein, partial [Chitinophagales bacterium]|nr:MlaD family protein [Chitinophagales bacterium]
EVINNIRLGLFVIIGTGLLIVALYFIGSNTNLFSKTFKVYAKFENVNGLKKGNNVRYAGIDVGTIKKIEIVNDTTIRVEMSIESDLKKVIRINSMASIGTDGLMGNKLINISSGSADSALINDGALLASVPILNTDEMLRTLDKTNKNILVISANLRSITQNITDSRGTLYTVLMDTSISAQLRHTLHNVDVVSTNILQMSADLNSVVSDAKNGNGLIATLVSDTVMSADLIKAVKEIKSAGEQVNSSAGTLKVILEKAKNGNGTVATLINDTASANSLKRSLVNVEISTQKFSENMEALKHNFLFKGYFTKQEKENRKLQKK